MTSIRTFIAISLPQNIQDQLAKVIHQFKELNCNEVRWVSPNNIHLTIKFLGDVSTNNIAPLVEAIQNEALCHTPFEIEIGGVGAFPNHHHPRVIWAGSTGPPALATLQHAIDIETSRLGYAKEERPFSPHLTLGRVSISANPSAIRRISDALSTLSVGILGKVMVESIHIYKSDLHPGGPIYTKIYTNNFAQPITK